MSLRPRLRQRERTARCDRRLESPLQLPSAPHRLRRSAPGLTPPRRRRQRHDQLHLVGEAAEAGEVMSQRTAWRICRDNQWWSVFGKKRAKNRKRPGPPVHDGLVQRDFSADDVNELWLTDIPRKRDVPPTELPTDKGKLYLCAIKDVLSGRIVGYSMSDR